LPNCDNIAKNQRLSISQITNIPLRWNSYTCSSLYVTFYSWSLSGCMFASSLSFITFWDHPFRVIDSQ